MFLEENVPLNLDTLDDLCIIILGKYIDTNIDPNVTWDLQENHHIFSWSYVDMHSMDPNTIVHNIVLNPDAKSIKQKLCHMHPKVVILVKKELQNLSNADFI